MILRYHKHSYRHLAKRISYYGLHPVKTEFIKFGKCKTLKQAKKEEAKLMHFWLYKFNGFK